MLARVIIKLSLSNPHGPGIRPSFLFTTQVFTRYSYRGLYLAANTYLAVLPRYGVHGAGQAAQVSYLDNRSDTCPSIQCYCE